MKKTVLLHPGRCRLRLFIMLVILMLLSPNSFQEVRAQSLFPDRSSGTWHGFMKIFTPEGRTDSVRVQMQIEPLKPNTWMWKTTYLSEKPVIKDYILRLSDPLNMIYTLDEQDGIQLLNFELDGKRFTQFKANDILLNGSYELIQDHLIFEILAWKPIDTFSLDITNYSPASLQRSILSRKPGIVDRDYPSRKEIALVFTGDEFGDGGSTIDQVLTINHVPASFFLTGNFYRNPGFSEIIRQLKKNHHYLGAHSDQHLLYCSWEDQDSLLVTEEEFCQDLEANYAEMLRFGVTKEDAPYFLPPYEWANDTIRQWTEKLGIQLINYTPGTLSHADYTTPDDPNYSDSKTILKSILEYESAHPDGLNGFILLSHIGAAPQRADKFYSHLDTLIQTLGSRGYTFVRIDQLLLPGKK